MIKEAAILKDRIIYTGRRHDVIYEKFPQCLELPHTQGFITNGNIFMDRKEAGQHAYDCGQIKRWTDCLVSEDLY